MISPKAQFLLVHKKEAEALAKMANESTLTVGCNYAMTELAYRGISEAQMQGVRMAFETLLSLPNKDAEPPKLPERQLRPIPTVEELSQIVAKLASKK